MNQTEQNNSIAIASIQLALIQPAFNGTFSCWESDYRGGFDALIPKERTDKGHSRRLDADAMAKICELMERYPKLSATGICRKMISDGIIDAAGVSVTTIQRFVKNNHLKGAAAPGRKDRRAFEEEFSTGMYQANTLYGPRLKENGALRQTYCIMILDDKSRLIVGGRFFYQDNSVNFQKVLRDAVATYGIPNKLYVDNSSPYKNIQLSFICGQLGCVLIHTPVRDGASKGKVERNFRPLRSRFLNALEPDKISGIEELNRLLLEYIRTHNTTVHSATGLPPYTRYMKDISHFRMPKSVAWLEECFLHRVKRRVNNDATICLNKTLYDAPMEFIRSTVEVRYRPGEPDSSFILDGDKQYPLRLTDKASNSKVKRTTSYSVRYGGGL